MINIYYYLFMLRPWLPVLALLTVSTAAAFGAYRTRSRHLFLYLAAATFLFLSFVIEQLTLGFYETRTDFPDGSVRFTINQTYTTISLIFQTIGWLLAIAGGFMQIRHTATTSKNPSLHPTGDEPTSSSPDSVL
jgi:hypothetical protein